jgi:hypothetical protein
MIKNLGKLKILKLLLVSVTLSSAAFANSVHSKQQKPVTEQDIKQILLASKYLKLKRKKVGMRLEYINAEMAKIIDSKAEHDTTTVREAVQEISYRIRQAIEKFEEKYDVGVELYHPSKKGLKNVTGDFIKENFPFKYENPYLKKKQDLKQQLYTYTKKTVGIRLKHINRLMAEIIDNNAEYEISTIREAAQEVSDRILIVIDKYEKQHGVCLVVYHESKKDLENVTADFIKETFPHAIVPSDC